VNIDKVRTLVASTHRCNEPTPARSGDSGRRVTALGGLAMSESYGETAGRPLIAGPPKL